MVTKTDKSKENGLAVLSNNEALAKMYQENAHLGSENLGGNSPLLKVHAAGRSTSNVLENGEEPNDGYFFYKPTGEQFKEIECHILTISRGFRTDGMDDKKNVFNQIMAGVIVNDGKPRTFLMYMTGVKLRAMWDFGKEISKYVHTKPVGVPMFALKVKLTTKKEVVEYKPGKKTNVWLINFEIMKDSDGSLLIVTNPKTFTYLRTQFSIALDMIDGIIQAKSPEETKKVEDLNVVAEEELDGKEENVSPDDIPF